VEVRSEAGPSERENGSFAAHCRTGRPYLSWHKPARRGSEARASGRCVQKEDPRTRKWCVPREDPRNENLLAGGLDD
jgi:hypothetical protein